MNELSGGYTFVREARRPSFAASVLPQSLWTPSSCICELYPANWVFPWATPLQSDIDGALSNLGLALGSFAPLRRWAEQEIENGDLAPPGIFLRLEKAREFERRFVRAGSELKLIGLGLPNSYVQEFLTEAAKKPNEASSGVYLAVESGASLAPGGTSLGFEPLGYEYGEFHSFICNSLERDFTEKLGLSLNKYGKFGDLETCRQAVEHTELDETGAEPALWLPWRVVDYPR